MATGVSSSTPYAQLWARLVSLARIKRVVITGGMTAFFIAYFATLNFTFFPPLEMPVTAVDRWIDFSPPAIWLYASLWIYVTLVPALLDRPRDLLIYYLSAGFVCIVGLLFFLLWPTTTPHADIDWARYPWYQPLKSIDRSGNAFPSLHAGFAVFSAIWLDRVLRLVRAGAALRLINLSWALGILYSTVATRQHVAIDVFAGCVLGFAGSALQLLITRWMQKPPELISAVAGKIQ